MFILYDCYYCTDCKKSYKCFRSKRLDNCIKCNYCESSTNLFNCADYYCNSHYITRFINEVLIDSGYNEM